MARRFQRRLARRNADPWLISTGQDLRFPTTTGMPVTAAMRLLNRYLDRVGTAATEDLATAHSFGKVIVMLARPTSLFAPRVLAVAARTRADADGVFSNSTPPARPLVSAAAVASAERPRKEATRDLR
ncbi:MAG: hypothetical protein WCF33_17295 [Pseudonocardiaceae bacterium]